MASNEYWRRYALKIITITWSRDSHGLFDFETRQLARSYFQTTEPNNFVREGEACRLINPEVDVKSEYKSKAQLLLQVAQKRN